MNEAAIHEALDEQDHEHYVQELPQQLEDLSPDDQQPLENQAPRDFGDAWSFRLQQMRERNPFWERQLEGVRKLEGA